MATDDWQPSIGTGDVVKDALFWSALAAGSIAGSFVLTAVALCEWNYVVAGIVSNRQRRLENSS